jgi:hypothetical protein
MGLQGPMQAIVFVSCLCLSAALEQSGLLRHARPAELFVLGICPGVSMAIDVKKSTFCLTALLHEFNIPARFFIHR